MGKIKDTIYDIADIISKLQSGNVKPEHIDMELRQTLGQDMYAFYQENIEFIDELVDDMSDYGSGYNTVDESIIMPSINEFFRLDKKK